MVTSEPVAQRLASPVFRYGLAVICVIATVLATDLLQDLMDGPPVFLFLAAVMISTWIGGIGPGMVAILLSILAIDYFFLSPLRILTLKMSHLPRIFVFMLSALLISWLSERRKRAEAWLRQARDELEVTVQERTAELRQANQELQAEIVERGHAEEALHEKASLLDLTHDTVFVRTMDDVITYWNRGAEELYGWTREEAVGKISHELMQTAFPTVLEQITADLVRAGRWEGELVQTRRDGTDVVVASRWSLQRDAEGRPTAILETNNDISRRKRAEEELHKVQAELARVTRVMTMGELTASIAHEVNQPLAAVVTNGNACLRWLAGKTPNLDEAREAVNRIIRDGNRASEVITRIRGLFKKAQTVKARLQINEIIGEVIALTHDTVLRNRISLRTELAADLPLVTGDRVQLHQVILNLVMNGMEAMSEITDRPRELVIRSQRHESDGVWVAVQDSGLGIDPRNRDRLFEPFFTTKSQGMGMGLSISRSIIQTHGGRMWATPNPGKGATFQFSLPPEGSGLQ